MRSACLSVCLSVRKHIIGTAGQIFTKFLRRFPVAVARSSSGGVAIPEAESAVYECLVYFRPIFHPRMLPSRLADGLCALPRHPIAGFKGCAHRTGKGQEGREGASMDREYVTVIYSLVWTPPVFGTWLRPAVFISSTSPWTAASTNPKMLA